MELRRGRPDEKEKNRGAEETALKECVSAPVFNFPVPSAKVFVPAVSFVVPAVSSPILLFSVEIPV